VAEAKTPDGFQAGVRENQSKEARLMTQLAFPFIEPEPAISPRPSRYRMRLKKIAGQAFELGRRQGKRRTPIKGNVNAIIKPAPLPALPVYLNREDRNELSQIIRRLERLNLSHRSPEDFFIERSEIVHALRRIAGQGEIVKCRARR
jgi:hypothetical protein